MASIGFTYWQDEKMWLGYLDEYPDYMTQGTSLDDLKEHLLDLYNDLSSGVVPHVRQHSELELAWSGASWLKRSKHRAACWSGMEANTTGIRMLWQKFASLCRDTMKLTNISREISYDGYPNYDVSVKPNATEFCGTPPSKLLPSDFGPSNSSLV